MQIVVHQFVCVLLQFFFVNFQDTECNNIQFFAYFLTFFFFINLHCARWEGKRKVFFLLPMVLLWEGQRSYGKQMLLGEFICFVFPIKEQLADCSQKWRKRVLKQRASFVSFGVSSHLFTLNSFHRYFGLLQDTNLQLVFFFCLVLIFYVFYLIYFPIATK